MLYHLCHILFVKKITDVNSDSEEGIRFCLSMEEVAKTFLATFKLLQQDWKPLQEANIL